MYEAANALRRNVALFCRRITTFLEMHSDSTLVRVIMDESAVSSLRAVLNIELSCSFDVDNKSSLNMPIFFFANATIIAMWIFGDLKREAYNASNS